LNILVLQTGYKVLPEFYKYSKKHFTYISYVCILEIMKISNYEIFELQAELYAIMSNPKRLMIVEVLSHGETPVSALAEALDISISTASQHLRIMRDKGLVVARKSAQSVFYRLRDPKITDCCHAMRNILLEQLQANGKMANNIDLDNLLK